MSWGPETAGYEGKLCAKILHKNKEGGGEFLRAGLAHHAEANVTCWGGREVSSVLALSLDQTVTLAEDTQSDLKELEICLFNI